MNLKITVGDKNGKSLYCKIVVHKLHANNPKASGMCVETVYCNGEYMREYKSGLYDVAIYRGKLYTPYQCRLELDTCDVCIKAVLYDLLDTESMGLYSFDAHSHVSRDEALDTGNLLSASEIMRGEGFNFFFAGSPYDHETHLEYINKVKPAAQSYRERFAHIIESVNDEKFILDIGNETIKCRYGHVFVLNYEQYPPFYMFYDHEFDPWLFTKIGCEPEYRISYIHEALLNVKQPNSIAVSAHPTSWWWHDNGEFITNIAATIGFELLAGSIDALVVMGYQSDHKYYQELWFDALNNGYFLPGVAETDAAFDTVPGDFLSFKTFTYATSFNIDDLCVSIKKGRNIVSSGPLITILANDMPPGSVLKRSDNMRLRIKVEAFSCYQAPLSTVQIIRDGNICKEYDINLNHFIAVDYIDLEADGFIIAKCRDLAGNTAITNPIYIRDEPFLNIGYLSKVRVRVLKDNKPAGGSYWIDDGQQCLFENEIFVEMKPSAILNIRVGNDVKKLRLFELPELQEIFKNLYMGWFNKERLYMPGEVPAELFQLKRIREILDNAELIINF